MSSLWSLLKKKPSVSYELAEMERQEAAIDFTGNAELEAERADHAGMFGEADI